MLSGAIQQMLWELKQSFPESYIDLEKRLKEVVTPYDLPFKVAAFLARQGCFVTHESFSSNQSMHYWDCCLYYEDGANLTRSGFVDNLPDLLKTGWRVKYMPNMVDKDKLDAKHRARNGLMLDSGSYEDFIIKDSSCCANNR